MCPNCRAFITTNDRVCPYCDVKLGPRAVDRRSPSDVGWIPAARFTTTVILLINLGLYLATVLFSMRGQGGGSLMAIDGQTLILFGAKVPFLIAAGEYWRLITAGFLHGGLFHIMMNSWVIYDLGTSVEETYGTSKYLTLYLVSTVFGFVASTWWSPSLSVGASAGLFGLIGAMIAAGLKTRTPLGSALRAHYTQWAIYGLAIGLLPMFRVDNAAHLGGLAAGFALAYAAGTRRLTAHWTDKLWTLTAVVSVLVTLAAFAYMLRFLLRYASSAS
jgi:rhomboid protease GluP